MLWCLAGIAPDSKQVTEQSEGLEQERKQVRESLISAYEKNIATRLKAEICSMEVNNQNITKDACASRSSFLSLRAKQS